MKKLIANVIDSYWSIKQFYWLIDYGLMDWLNNRFADLIEKIEQLIFDVMIDLFIYWTAIYLLTNWVAGRFFKCMFNFIKPAMTKNAIWCSAVSFISNNLGFIWIFYNNVFWVKIHVAIKQNAGHIMFVRHRIFSLYLVIELCKG